MNHFPKIQYQLRAELKKSNTKDNKPVIIVRPHKLKFFSNLHFVHVHI